MLTSATRGRGPSLEDARPGRAPCGWVMPCLGGAVGRQVVKTCRTGEELAEGGRRARRTLHTRFWHRGSCESGSKQPEDDAQAKDGRQLRALIPLSRIRRARSTSKGLPRCHHSIACTPPQPPPDSSRFSRLRRLPVGPGVAHKMEKFPEASPEDLQQLEVEMQIKDMCVSPTRDALGLSCPRCRPPGISRVSSTLPARK